MQGQAKDLLKGVPLCVDLGNHAISRFMTWQLDMRGALSRLPTASGPWIWEPPPERDEIEYSGNFCE